MRADNRSNDCELSSCTYAWFMSWGVDGGDKREVEKEKVMEERDLFQLLDFSWWGFTLDWKFIFKKLPRYFFKAFFTTKKA